VRPDPEPQIVVKGRPSGVRPAPELRLTGEPAAGEQGAEGGRSGAEGEDGGDLPVRSLLTAEELAMLLADDRE
jgi:hypothetical protein